MSLRGALSLDRQCVAIGLPAPVAEYHFAKPQGRRWRFDWAWPSPEHMLAVEIEGGLYIAGRHSRGAGMEQDLCKYAAALLLGWRVLRVSTGQVRSGIALCWIQQALKG